MRKPVRFPREKLLNIKTARFYGKVFVEQDLSVLFKKLRKAKTVRFCDAVFLGPFRAQEIAGRQNIYILERRCFLGPLGPKKLKSFFQKKGKHIF